MSREKNYKATLPSVMKGSSAIDDSIKLCLPRNPGNHRQIDHSQYLGSGFDEWAIQSIFVIKILLESGNFSVPTLIGYSVNGLRYFLAFLCSGVIASPPATPNHLTRYHLERFVSWLKLKYPNASTAKNYYSSFKSLVILLADYGFIDGNIREQLPSNPFPNNARQTTGAEPLSVGEMQRLMSALKSDLVAIHKGEFIGNGAETMSVMLLIIAARSGINTTPLLEMSRDALQPHPFVPNLRLINTVKRRGKGAQIKTIRQTNIFDEYSSIPLDGVSVLNKALEISEPLVKLASEEINSYVWLYRSGQPGAANKIVALTSGALSLCAKNICERHELKNDKGERLNVSPSRLRKTMESRLWKLSGGDIIEVSSIMGHSPAVADNHYLKINDEIKVEGTRFVGEVFPDKLRGISITPTPPGGCKDTFYGNRAPKDGLNHCSEFIHCLGCPSYAIVGTLEDLYRLFSYQQFLYAEVEYLLDDEWAEWRKHQNSYILLINEFTSRHFDTSLTAQARSKAELAPHPFWAKKIEFMKKKTGGVI
ncbi:hypothetical protein RRL14_25160 (plasmid) [Citrobacter freundii]|uniref:hypothetical protein n=2 Tax=Enterobacterales TaxID=91347 RepID=UPI0028ED8C9E|nr:hypothetical protein [Citrobacter freundii]HCL6427996.1 hypothetical protein [Escherichia coli]WNT00136.1 hypothetical protein RRL14_12285 [Citrobacter freundii]WNT04673.1 hypothetical protein RRL14_24195 [Citrobacter freundii]WNT04966.1 hypothetical protein RRL14_25160 [Citrobacter freundii]HCL6312621.1 hypothetical protein [Citrobacter freundii]